MTRYAAEHIIQNGKDDMRPWLNRYFIEEGEVHAKLAEQREEIRLLSEQVNAANQELLRRDQTNEYLASTIRKWEKVCQDQAVQLERKEQEITRLRERIKELADFIAVLQEEQEPT